MAASSGTMSTAVLIRAASLGTVGMSWSAGAVRSAPTVRDCSWSDPHCMTAHHIAVGRAKPACISGRPQQQHLRLAIVPALQHLETVGQRDRGIACLLQHHQRAGIQPAAVTGRDERLFA